MSEQIIKALKEEVFEANIALWKSGLVIFTWGNVSGLDRKNGLVAIKPGGVPYETMKADDIVVLELESGKAVHGTKLKPSSDTPTHLEIYRKFPGAAGVVHTHSRAAVAFAQAKRPIPCFGTTHADYFHGSVPVTAELSEEEIKHDYELNTGRAITALWKNHEADAMAITAALVAKHGPFTWGSSAAKAVENAIVLEEIAVMALQTLSLNPLMPAIDKTLLDKHFCRKHGPNAYYGQK